MAKQPLSYTIKLGDNTIEYHLYETDAPRDYDGFGTFTLADYGDGRRLVFIRKEHVGWQRARYGSGFQASKVPDNVNIGDVTQELYQRLRREQE